MSNLFFDNRDFNEDISRWNVSNVVRMNSTFNGATSFNGDLSGWDVRQVRSMIDTFSCATSFDRQLGGAWSTSEAWNSEMFFNSPGTASKDMMFCNSPGTIAGKTKLADGTIE